MVPAFIEDTGTFDDWDDNVSDPDGEIRAMLNGDVTGGEYDEQVGAEHAALPTLSNGGGGRQRRDL